MNGLETWLNPLAELFDALEDVLVWIKDREGRYRWVNRAFLIRLALDRRDFDDPTAAAVDSPPPDLESLIVGKTDYDLSPPFLADQFRLDDEHVLEGHRIVDRIELVGRPHGLNVWNLTNKIPLTDRAGKVVGTAGITRPLQDQKSPAASRPGNTANANGVVPGGSSGGEFSAVLAHMRDHFQSPVTNRELAKIAHMSVRAFERKFQAGFHLTPQKYLRKLRMRMASRALVYTKQTLAEVAVASGFSDQSHFTREFRRHFGRTPRDYREHYQSRQSTLAAGKPRRSREPRD